MPTLTRSQLGHRVTTVRALANFRLLLTFDGHDRRMVDIKALAKPGGVFEPVLQSPAVFEAVRIRGRGIEWPDGPTPDPDLLYAMSTPAQ